ncbi:uncharacterized protein [Vulpes vulpes]
MSRWKPLRLAGPLAAYNPGLVALSGYLFCEVFSILGRKPEQITFLQVCHVLQSMGCSQICATESSLNQPINPFAGHPSAFRKKDIQTTSDKELPPVTFTISSGVRTVDILGCIFRKAQDQDCKIGFWPHLSHSPAGDPGAVTSLSDPPLSQL